MSLRKKNPYRLLKVSPLSTLVIAFDLQKTFDTVYLDHAILLHKMRLYGMSDSVVEWFCSY